MINLYLRLPIHLFLGLVLFVACDSEKNTGVKGDNNSDNNIVIGDNNTVNLERHRGANQNNLPFSIVVDNEFLNTTWREDENRSFVEPEGEKLTYNVILEDDFLRIEPSLNYLNLFRDKGPVETRRDYGFGAGIYFPIQYPNLDIRLVNNSDETVFFERAEFRVIKSIVDPEPVIVFIDFRDRAFTVYKESWGELFNCYVTYNIYPVDEVDFDYQNYLFTQTGIEIDKDKYVPIDIHKDLINTGFDYEKCLETGYYAQMTTLYERIDAMGKYRPYEIRNRDEFENNFEFEWYYNQVIVAGKFYFTWIDENGNKIDDYVKFKTNVTLFAERGAAGESSFQYRTMLRTYGNNYIISENIAQYVKPYDIDRFHFLVGAEKSSIHILKLRLYYNNGKFIESDEIRMKIFFPRSSTFQLKYLMNKNSKGEVNKSAISSDLVVWVDKLNLRKQPNLDSEVIALLNEGTKLKFNGVVSKKKIRVRLRGNIYTDFFYKVKTNQGKEGWVHGGAIR